MTEAKCYSHACYFGRCDDCKHGCQCECHKTGRAPAVTPYQQAWDDIVRGEHD